MSRRLLTQSTKKPVISRARGLCDIARRYGQAALRELEEETGYRAKSIKKLISFHPFIGRSNALCHIFFTNELEKSHANPDEDECFELLETEPSRALKYIDEGKITHAGAIIGILLARKKGLI